MAGFAGANSIADTEMSTLLSDVMDLANKHHVKLPGTYTLLARSVLAIEGVIEQLCPKLNLLELVTKKMMERLKKSFDLKKSLIDAGKGILGTGKKAAQIPALAHDVLKGMSKGKMKLNTEITGLEEPIDQLGALVKNVVLAFVACILFIGGCILCTVNIEPMTTIGIPLLSAVLLLVSVALGIFAILRMGKKKK